jgi:hypothetical protein
MLIRSEFNIQIFHSTSMVDLLHLHPTPSATGQNLRKGTQTRFGAEARTLAE